MPYIFGTRGLVWLPDIIGLPGSQRFHIYRELEDEGIGFWPTLSRSQRSKDSSFVKMDGCPAFLFENGFTDIVLPVGA